MLCKVSFDSKKHIEHVECQICLMEYKEGDEITILNCSTKHYFHRECMIQNIKAGNLECPLCRTDITECMMMDEHVFEPHMASEEQQPMMAAEEQPLLAEEEEPMMAEENDD